VAALAVLDDSELGLFQELVSLANAGFRKDQIQTMMAPESFEAACEALEKADQEHDRLIQEARRPQAVRKGRVLKARKSWLEEHTVETEDEGIEEL